MRKNGYSSAFRDYESSLRRAALLRNIERQNYKDPPPPKDRHAVEALRGGATVLMIAVLEKYLKDALEEYVNIIATKAGSTRHKNIPSEIAECNDINFIEGVIRSNRMKKPERISE